RVEALADAEQEHPDDQEGDEDGEGDADLDDERHAARAGRGEDQAVLERHEADHLAHRVAPRDHHEEAEEKHRQRERQVLAHEHALGRGDGQHHDDREGDECHADEHRRPDTDDGLDRAMDAEAHHDAMQGDRNEHPLEGERDERRDVEVRRALQVGLPADRERQHAGVEREEIEQREHAVLIEEEEAHEQHRACEEVGDVAVERGQCGALETNSRMVPRRPSMSATPRNSGTRKTRILAMAVSKSDNRKPRIRSYTAEVEESSVEPAKRESVNTAISIAGSASVANIISRLDPMPPKLVPTSSPASASVKRAVPSSATMTMRSAAAPSARPVAKVGTRAAATQVLAKTAYGAVR